MKFSSDFLFSFFSTVAYHLEDQKWGRFYHCIQPCIRKGGRTESWAGNKKYLIFIIQMKRTGEIKYAYQL
ncbi:hypothetical protein H6A65_14715 [Mediterraneibacter glycyrrhizinilyticus]|nr:hypothetical protein [Mediterraneibacter glycyrrhizinilyticus]